MLKIITDFAFEAMPLAVQAQNQCGYVRPSQGFRGIRPFISAEQGNKGLRMRGMGKQRLWNRNIGNQDFHIGEQENEAIYFWKTKDPTGRAS